MTATESYQGQGMSELVWSPSPERRETSTMSHFQKFLEQRGIKTSSYSELHAWSISNLDDFWSQLWDFADVRASSKGATVRIGDEMPYISWFPEARLNYAENILSQGNGKEFETVVVELHESGQPRRVTWSELKARVAALVGKFKQLGLVQGDRVAAILPNALDAIVGLLAAASMGTVWSIVNPDFGKSGILDRFSQIKPKVLLVVDGYEYNGKWRSMAQVNTEVANALPDLNAIIVADRHGPLDPYETNAPSIPISEIPWVEGNEPVFSSVPFSHPLWIVYSSGTTGRPKGLVHSHGGITLESIKSVRLQYDIRQGDRCYFAVSTSWVLWNMFVGALLAGASIVTYDGSPKAGGVARHFRNISETDATFFGTGAAILTMIRQAGCRPSTEYELSCLTTILSTGSPLPSSTWDWVREHVNESTKLSSDSGGTDVATSFLGMNPLDPIYKGELQGPGLGVAAEAWDDNGARIIDRVGEFVITQPMPSMPVKFWDDPDMKRYKSSYFDDLDGVWRHGDWVTETSRGTFVVHGRSDATINRGGIRMGSSDITRYVDEIDGVVASMVLGIELGEASYYMPLFVVLEPNQMLDDDLRTKIISTIRREVSPRYVPDEIIQAPGLPTTRTGKLMEIPIKRLFQEEDGASINRGTVTDNSILDWYADKADSFRKSGL